MAGDHPRRASAAPALAASSAIPPAPPLPPQKHPDPSQKYTSAFASPNSLSSQDASHKTGLEITALDINHERTHAILAGREILKTIRVAGTRCAEESNLRAAILNYNNAAHSSSGSGGGPRSRDTLEIHDVKWSHGQFSSHIATAATNGKVIIYDLNRTGVELARLHEHHRQVHKVAFNPHQGYLLLSGSQDDTVRLWDLRDLRKDIMSFTSRDKFLGMSGPVRDLRWSPTDGVEFAFGTDNGVIHRWNYRMNRGPLLKINAHDKTCTAIDWHPDGKYLVSASKDKTVKVWDFSSDQRRQKPAYVIRAPYPVYNARWRPPCWQADGQDHGIWKCTMLATSYDRDHPVVHLWNFQRPFLPFREISRYSTAPTDMLWQHRDLIWTVGREGIFTQTDVQYAPKVIDRRNMQALALSPTGDLCGFVQRRHRRIKPGPGYRGDDSYLTDDKSISPEKQSLSRSSADDSVDDAFLSSAYKKHHGRSASNRSARSLGSSQPSSEPAQVMTLDEGVDVDRASVQPSQVALRGVVPGTVNVPIFTYLAQKYKMIPLPESPTIESFNEVRRVFDQNAEYAQRAAFYRLAETWKMIGFSTKMAIQRRAQERRRRRLRPGPMLPAERRLLSGTVASKEEQGVPAHPAIRAIIQENGNHVKSESSSNAATPLARPQLQLSVPGRHHELLPDPDQAEGLALPAAIIGSNTSQNDQLTQDIDKRPGLLRPVFDGPGWYSSSPDLSERRATMGSWRAQPRPLLTLETAGGQSVNERMPSSLDRRSSEDSFTMFSASTDSRQPQSIGSSFASKSSHPRSMESLPERWEHNHNHLPGSGSECNSLVRAMEVPLQASMDSHNITEKIRIPRSISENPIGHQSSLPAASFGLNGASIHKAGETPAADVHQQSARSASSPTKIIQRMETLRKNNQLIRQTSSESNIHASRKSSFSNSSLQAAENTRSSGMIAADESAEVYPSPQHPVPPPKLQHEAESAPAALQTITTTDIENEPLILSDFLALDTNSDAENSSPFTVVDMLNQLLTFHTTTLSDAQTPAHLLLLLLPLLPPSHPLDAASTATILASYADHLTTTGLSPTQVSTILSTHIHYITLTGINPLQAESILAAYHAQLCSLGLHTAAAYLRRLAYPAFPALQNQITNPRDGMRCETCRARQAECPVCWSRYPPFEGWTGKAKKKKEKEGEKAKSHAHTQQHHTAAEPDTVKPLTASVSPHPTLYTTCALCSHTAHLACLNLYFADPASEGACPTPGCLCDCVNGVRRAERLRLTQARKAEKERVRGAVAGRDEWRVGESRAVGAARGVLGTGLVAGGGGGRGRRGGLGLWSRRMG
ncbi:SEA (Seh1-associated) complex subunit [Coniosporium tulheliwenetii]|uniref:SEA (Seh1-associated) complex subunit n=1 Tax=Coniosporium tulheliwenetii TaxID=3383036 RepID=A0ACC2YM68_9PEZI|nr:SEA (Seh1-associated) complex subunit [Cladosporium sp. JES 115]